LILAVAKEDAPAAMALLQEKAAREGESTTDASDDNTSEDACPACGTIAGDAETCSDCGLRLK